MPLEIVHGAGTDEGALVVGTAHHHLHAGRKAELLGRLGKEGPREVDGAAHLRELLRVEAELFDEPLVVPDVVDVTDVDSPALFRLLGWDPGIRAGKVRGSLSTSGAEFDPEGWFEYRNDRPGAGILDRIQNISGRYSLRGQSLSLTGLTLAAAKSRLAADGLVDTGKETLDIAVRLETGDLGELLSPYYSDISGRGEFIGKVAGTFSAPRLEGDIKIHAPVLRGVHADAIDAEVSYRKDLLDIRRFSLAAAGAEMTLRGSIAFPAAKDLFDLTDQIGRASCRERV